MRVVQRNLFAEVSTSLTGPMSHTSQNVELLLTQKGPQKVLQPVLQTQWEEDSTHLVEGYYIEV